ncbi:MAG: ComEC family competence protein [Fluviicola sp.]|nr:ComEC family competence protein [Fluviicola sp.]
MKRIVIEQNILLFLIDKIEPPLRKYPLLLPALFLFIGGLVAYWNIFTSSVWFASLITTFCLIFLLFFMLPSFWDQRINRLATTSLFFFLVGGTHFSLNDWRNNSARIHANLEQQTFVAKVIEVKKQTSLRQTLILDVQQSKRGELLDDAQGKMLMSYELKQPSDGLVVDDRVVVCTKVNPIQNRNNPGEFDAVYYYQSKGIVASAYANSGQVMVIDHQWSWNGLFTNWRNSLAHSMEDHLQGVFLGIAKALILGDKSNLEQEDVESFTNTGSMHVLAVSGLHVGLLLMMISKVLELFSKWISKRNALVLSLLLIWIYGFISGASPSVMRAVLMFSVSAAAQFFKRKNSAVNGLFLSAIILFMLDPWVFFDIGFQLTYAAMLGIFFLYEPIRDLLFFQSKILRLTWEGTAVGIAATIVTTPLTLFWFYQFPNYFALANLGVMVFGFLVLLGGMLFLFTSWIPGVGAFVAFLFSLTIIGLVKWVGLIDQIPGAVSSGFQLSLFELALLFLVVFAWIIFIKKGVKTKRILAVCSIALIGLISFKRLHVLQQEQLMVLKSNQFMLLLRSNEGNIAFYEPKLGVVEQIPQEIKAVERFTGTHFRTHVLHVPNLQVTLGKEQLILKKVKEGWSFSWKGKDYFYRQKGTPNQGENARLMSVKTQNYLAPITEQKPFILNY